METVPRDRPVRLLSGKTGGSAVGMFRRTRRFVNHAWRQNEFWADPVTNRAIGFRPAGWRERE